MIFVILGQTRIPLTRAAAEDPVEVLEPPPVRPAVERARRSLLSVGREVPLPERGRAVPVVLQDPGQRCAIPRQGRRVAREPAGELTDRAEPHGVVVATRQQRGAGRGAKGGHVEAVVPQALLGHAGVVRCVDRSAEGTGVPEAGVVDQDQQDVRRPLWRGGVPDQVPVGLRTVERPVRGSREGLATDRETGSVGLSHHPRLPGSSVALGVARAAMRRVSSVQPMLRSSHGSNRAAAWDTRLH